MKTSTTHRLIILLVATICMVSCKKEALVVKKNMHYYQINTDPKDVDGIFSQSITLGPNGQAGFRPGGDIEYKATYKIKGKKITVTIIKDPKLTSYFTIISDTELHAENGAILMLDKSYRPE